ncbi:hypothetical protein VTO73DRAFT_14453 [Trametes versicolor]
MSSATLYSAELGHAAVQSEVTALKIMKMTLDVELGNFMDEHRLSLEHPEEWITELVNSLHNRHAAYREKFSNMVHRQSRALQDLTALTDFDKALQDMVQVESQRASDLSKVETLYEQKRDKLDEDQRSFFGQFLSATRQSHVVCVTQRTCMKARFDEIRPRLEFLSQPREQLFAFTSSLPPYATRDATRVAVTPAVNVLRALGQARENAVARARKIESEAAQWNDQDIPYGKRVEALTLLQRLREDMERNRPLQSAALAKITLQTIVANGASVSLPGQSRATWKVNGGRPEIGSSAAGCVTLGARARYYPEAAMQAASRGADTIPSAHKVGNLNKVWMGAGSRCEARNRCGDRLEYYNATVVEHTDDYCSIFVNRTRLVFEAVNTIRQVILKGSPPFLRHDIVEERPESVKTKAETDWLSWLRDAYGSLAKPALRP